MQEIQKSLDKEKIANVIESVIINQDVCLCDDAYLDTPDWKDLLDISFSISGSTYHFYSCCGLYQIEDRTLPINKMVDMARLCLLYTSPSPRDA